MMNSEVTDAQPRPNGNGQNVTTLVIGDLSRRSAAGKKKYGTVLKTFNGRDPLIDAYQEALDLVVYLRQAIQERKKR